MNALHGDEEWFCRSAWRYIADSPRKPDIVHAHALYQAARLRRDDVPVVINLPGEPNSRYRDDLRMADALIADGWAADHLPSILGQPVERVPKGIDSELFTSDGPSLRQALRLTDRRVVVTVARLVPIKNVALLVDAMARVRELIPEAHLLVVGDGTERDALRDRAGALGIADAVTFAGSVRHDETPPFYRAADVFALSSDFDNSPNVVLEAMACGLPVVATDVGGVRDFIADGVGGRIVAAGDAAALAGAIAAYLTSTDASRRAGSHNRMRAATDFSWRTSTLRLLDVYRRVVEAHRPGRASA